MAAPEVEVPIDRAMAGAAGDQRLDAQRTAERALPFSGLIDSVQLLGLGRLEVARALCAAHGLVPMPFDATHALVQLSFMQWNASPVGAYCASFVGVIVDANMTNAPRRSPPADRPNDRGPAARPRSSAVLSAFLAAPRALYVPVYTVGDRPHGPRGGGAASRRFGRESLDVFKTEGRFVVSESRGMRHIQIFEERARSIGAGGLAEAAGGAVHAPTGYTISATVASAQHAGSRSMSMLPPSLLPALPRLAMELGRAVRRGGAQAGGDAASVPAPTRADRVRRDAVHDAPSNR